MRDSLVEISEGGDPEVAPGELSGHLAGLSLPKQVLTLALWPFVEHVLGFVVGATDLFIAGRMGGPESVAFLLEALAVGAYIGWLIFIIQGAASTGATALVSRLTGARDAQMANRATAQAAVLSLGIGILLMLFIWFSAAFLAGPVFGLKGQALEAATIYLQIFSVSAPLSGLVFALNAAQRGAGETKTPFRVMLCVNLVNVCMSTLLVFGPEPIGGYGVEGLAIGTVLGWVVGAFLAVWVLVRRRVEAKLGVLRLSLSEMRPDKELMWRILRVGLPNSLEIGCMWLIHVAIARRISSLVEEGALGAHMIAIRLESMSFLPGFAIGIAASTLAGQYLGAENPQRAREAVAYCWKAAVLFMSVIGLGLIFFNQTWLEFFAPGAESIVDQAAPLVFLSGFAQPFLATCIVLKTAMRGAGATKPVLILSLGSQLFWRVLVLWAAVLIFDIGLYEMWVLLVVDIVCQTFLFWRYFRGGKWLETKV